MTMSGCLQLKQSHRCRLEPAEELVCPLQSHTPSVLHPQSVAMCPHAPECRDVPARSLPPLLECMARLPYQNHCLLVVRELLQLKQSQQCRLEHAEELVVQAWLQLKQSQQCRLEHAEELVVQAWLQLKQSQRASQGVAAMRVQIHWASLGLQLS
jgi:hypothetical protein